MVRFAPPLEGIFPTRALFPCQPFILSFCDVLFSKLSSGIDSANRARDCPYLVPPQKNLTGNTIPFFPSISIAFLPLEQSPSLSRTLHTLRIQSSPEFSVTLTPSIVHHTSPKEVLIRQNEANPPFRSDFLPVTLFPKDRDFLNKDPAPDSPSFPPL